MIYALIKRVSVTVNVMKCTHIGEKPCNCSCFEINQEMDVILLIIDIVKTCNCFEIDQKMDVILLTIYISKLFTGFVESSLNQYNICTYLLFFVNLLLVGVDYGQRTMQVGS